MKPAFEKRLKATQKDNFVDVMIEEVKKRKADFVRVHDSGDYYSKEYLLKWFAIAEALPNVKFYSYTNNINMIKKLKSIPINYDFIFSDSGKQKQLIDKNTDRHTKIFRTKLELDRAGYKDTSNFDLYATRWYNNSNNVGLIIH